MEAGGQPKRKQEDQKYRRPKWRRKDNLGGNGRTVKVEPGGQPRWRREGYKGGGGIAKMEAGR